MDLERPATRMDSLADLYRVTVEKAPYGVFIIDGQDRCIYVNEAGCRLSGREAVEILGRCLLDLMPEELRGRGREHLAQARRTASRGVRLPFARPDGGRRWWSVDALPVGDGRILGYVVDVTEQRQIQQDLLREKERLNRASDVARVGWWELDLVRGTVQASSHAHEIYGVPRGGRLTIADVQRIPLPEYRDYLDAALDDLVAGRRPYDVVYRIRRPADGATADIRSLAQYDRERNLVFGILQDVTEMRRLEDQLHQAQKMEAVGRLAGGVAHDFNNLLTPILGFADLVMNSHAEDDPRRRDLSVVVRAAERARDLTAQLLAFGRKQVLDVQVLCLNDVLRESETMLRRLLRENISLEIAPDPRLGAVRADLSQVYNVLINLVVNAADALPDGGTIRIETANVDLKDNGDRDRRGPHVMLEVHDDGCGIDPANLDLIFEPFFTTKGANSGTGLGLSTVDGIVKQHRGSVEVRSEPGRGTSVRVYLPRVAAEPQLLPSGERQRRLQGHERILLVEDDEAVRSLVGLALDKFGYRVEAAATPSEALSLVQTGLPACDLLLTDVVMPGMNGVQLHRALLEIWPGLPVLFMSGYTDNVIARHGILEEGLHFIQKPFAPQDLAAKVREVLDGRGHDEPQTDGGT